MHAHGHLVHQCCAHMRTRSHIKDMTGILTAIYDVPDALNAAQYNPGGVASAPSHQCPAPLIVAT